jgi:predicted GIY-YIG superfamily endonuclease
MFWLYILRCRDGSFYIGHTDDLDERMRQHDTGRRESYTASRRPLELIFSQEFESRYDALSMERQLKRWSRAKKEAYIAGDWKRIGELAKGRHRHERT